MMKQWPAWAKAAARDSDFSWRFYADPKIKKANDFWSIEIFSNWCLINDDETVQFFEEFTGHQSKENWGETLIMLEGVDHD